MKILLQSDDGTLTVPINTFELLKDAEGNQSVRANGLYILCTFPAPAEDKKKPGPKPKAAPEAA
jgi:hypothetical protein